MSQRPASRFLRLGAAASIVALCAALGAAPALAGPDDTASGDDPAAIAEHSLRGPVTDEVFYFVMADRFENGSTDNDTAGLGDDPMVSGFDPTSKAFYNGGDLAGLASRLDYIEGMGVDSIWLTPSFANKAVQPEDRSAGYHGYWITDFTRIDPHLGTNDELAALIDAAHERGMKVYFDIITNHTADVIGYEGGSRLAYVGKDEVPYRTADGDAFDDRDHAGEDSFPALDPATSFPYTPVLEPGEEDLKVPAWLNDVTLYHNRGDTTFVGEDSLYGDFFGLDDLFTEHPRVVEGMIDIYETWIADFGIDGFRIDTMKHVNDEFWQRFGPEVLAFARDAGKSEFFMFGEVFDTSKPFLSHFTTRGEMQSTLDFAFQAAARDYASAGGSPADLGAFFVADDWFTDADSNVYQLPTFLGNHDMGRIGFFVAEDNPDADDDELLARHLLAHDLLFLSRGNPVVYYGDEQGFTGDGGDQDARQTLFASQVEDYLADDLLGTDRTHAEDNFATDHPAYRRIAELAALASDHPALRDGAHQHRYPPLPDGTDTDDTDGDDTGAGGGEPGVVAFSRIAHDDGREYVVALNNGTGEATATVPTWVPGGVFEPVRGGDTTRTAGADGGLTVTVPALSSVVYVSSAPIPVSEEAPAISVAPVVVSEEDNARMVVAAEVAGDSFYEVTFQARTADGDWATIGTDDSAPFRVYHDVADLASGTTVAYRAVVADNGGHTAMSDLVGATVPNPIPTIDTPAAGDLVAGTLDVVATVDPERASHVVELQRSIDGVSWTTLGIDDSSPVYTAPDDVSDLEDGTVVRYRAVLSDADRDVVVGPVTEVEVGAPPVVQPDAVSVPGSFNAEIGCADDWLPDCPEAQLTLDEATGLWSATFEIPAGEWELKIAHDGSWDVNFGQDGAPNGPNLALTVVEGTEAVTFTYDPATHLVTATMS
ncbi:MAG: alpha-amylase family glycosyl hydrolase [Actinomycetota bacterium]|nr:alpha-amylase family glycosyl hydrolase [Actinomycetota bacterium]